MEKSFLFFIIISFQISASIINNPIELTEGSYPILLSSKFDDYNYIITSGKVFKISKENGTIVDTADFLRYNENFISIYDNNNSNYIYYGNEYYFINYLDFLSYKDIEVSSKSKSFTTTESVNNKGSIAQDNDFIIYGVRSNYFIFTSKSQEYRSYATINHLSDKFSCKFIEGNEFICAMIINENLEILLHMRLVNMVLFIMI